MLVVAIVAVLLLVAVRWTADGVTGAKAMAVVRHTSGCEKRRRVTGNSPTPNEQERTTRAY